MNIIARINFKSFKFSLFKLMLRKYQIKLARAITGRVLMRPFVRYFFFSTPSPLLSTVSKNLPSLLGRIKAATMYDNDRETNIAAPWLSDPNTSILIAPYNEPENITSKTICGRVDGSEKIVNAFSDLITCSGVPLFTHPREPTIG